MRSNIELREACKKAGVKGYYRMSNKEMEEKLKNARPKKKSNIELRERCKKAGVKGYYRMSNEEMEKKLKNAEEELARKQADQAKRKKKLKIY